MRILDADAVAAALPYPALVEELRHAFRTGDPPPPRQHLTLPGTGSPGHLLLMPAWDGPGSGPSPHFALKVVTVFPDNAARSLPSVMASVLLASAETGEPLAFLEGSELTARRTAAASALAASFLAREDAGTLLVVGTGRMAPHLARAHRGVRPLERILVWGRSPDRARALVRALEGDAGPGPLVELRVAETLAEGIDQADVVSCATLSREPLVRGAWIRPGTHLDLVGAYTPEMRETDAGAVRRAEVWVDTRDGARAEAGDLLQAEAEGAFAFHRIRGDLFQLCRGEVEGRTDPGEVTLFKSVGTALEDLAAARLAVGPGPTAPKR